MKYEIEAKDIPEEQLEQWLHVIRKSANTLETEHNGEIEITEIAESDLTTEFSNSH